MKQTRLSHLDEEDRCDLRGAGPDEELDLDLDRDLRLDDLPFLLSRLLSGESLPESSPKFHQMIKLRVISAVQTFRVLLMLILRDITVGSIELQLRETIVRNGH